MIIPLRLKSMIVGSPVENIAQRLRAVLSTAHRRKHPELWEIFLEERRLPEVLRKLLSPHSSVVDVGCHLGSFLRLVQEIAPRGKHIGVEASARKGEWLRSKFPTVEIHNVAVGEIDGEATFEENLREGGYSRLLGANEKTDNLYYTVTVKRLDDLITRKVDLLKLDIEGAELQALKGGVSIMDKSHPPILFECGSEYVLNKQSRRDLFDFLTDRGYGIHTFGDFLFNKGPMEFSEFQRCGLYPFRAFNFLALKRR